MSNITFIKSGPYADLDRLDARETHRFNGVISREHYDFITNICPLNGVMQFTIATLINSLVSNLKQNGITTYNPAEYINHLRRLTNSNVVGQKPGTDGSTGTPSVCPTPAPAAQSSNPRQRTKH